MSASNPEVLTSGLKILNSNPQTEEEAIDNQNLRTLDERLANLSPTELEYLDGVTPGEATAGKAVVPDATYAAQLNAAAALLDANGVINQTNNATVGGKNRKFPIVFQIIPKDAMDAGTLTGSAQITVAQDTVNFITPEVTGGLASDTLSSGAVKHTPNNWTSSDDVYCVIQTDMSPLKDMSQVTDILFRWYLYPGTEGETDDLNGLKTLDLVIFDDAGLTVIYRMYDNTGPSTVCKMTGGWYETTIHTSDMHSGSSAVLDWTKIKKIWMRMTRQAIGSHTLREMAPVITIDLIQFMTADKGRLMWRFDDANTAHYHWCSYLDSHRQRGCVGAIWANATTLSNNLTVADLRRLQDQGHLIANHSTEYHDSHTDPSYILDTDAFLASVQQSSKYMYQNGFYRGAKIFMLPGGKWNHDWDAAVGPYVDSVWFASNRWGVTSGVTSQVNSKFYGASFADTTTLTAAQMRALIDTAIVRRGLIGFYLHGNTPDSDKLVDVANYAEKMIEFGLLDCTTPYDYIRLPDKVPHSPNRTKIAGSAGTATWWMYGDPDRPSYRKVAVYLSGYTGDGDGADSVITFPVAFSSATPTVTTLAGTGVAELTGTFTADATTLTMTCTTQSGWIIVEGY